MTSLPPPRPLRDRRRRRVRRRSTPCSRWLKYRAYMDARYDLGNMVQAVYNTAHGHFLEITSGELKPRQMSRLGSHVDPILALFALPWLVWPSPVMLLVGQAVVVATGAWPAYRLGHAGHARPARRRPARRRLPALPGARLPGAQRVPPGGPRDAAAALGVPVPGRGPLGARRRLPGARGALQGDRAAGHRLHGRLLRRAQALAVAAHRHGARRRLRSPSPSGWSSRTSTGTRAPSWRATAPTATARAGGQARAHRTPGRR